MILEHPSGKNHSQPRRRMIRIAMEEEKQLRFTCPTPRCGAKFEEPLSWFQDNPSFTCPKCGNDHTLDLEKMPGAKEFFES